MRNQTLDAVKALSAYFVVLLHIRFPGRTGEIINVLARFAVPLFFMVSGYFCYRSDGKALKKLPGKIGHVFWLTVISYAFYVVWQCFQRSIEGKAVGSWLAEIVEREHIKEFLLYNNSTPVKWHLWFLPALLYCYVLFAVVERFRLHWAAYLLIPLLMLGHFWREEATVFTGEFYKTMEFRNYLYTGFPFFMLGHWIHSRKREPSRELEKSQIAVLWSGILVGSVLSIAEYFKYGLMELFVGSVILSVSVFLLAVSAGERCVPGTRYRNILAEIGSKYAFFIYLFHLAVADIVKDFAVLFRVDGTVVYGWLRPVLVCALTTGAAVGISALKHKLPVHLRKNVV